MSVLANRYASVAMRQIFSAEAKIVAERELWLAVARAQKKLGHPITDDQLSAYEKVKHAVHLDSIDDVAVELHQEGVLDQSTGNHKLGNWNT